MKTQRLRATGRCLRKSARVPRPSIGATPASPNSAAARRDGRVSGTVATRAADGFDDFIRLDEKFQFHLLELARAEGEIARRDFVAERLADLRDAERDFLPRRFQHIFELRENRLRGFGAEISDVRPSLSPGRRRF